MNKTHWILGNGFVGCLYDNCEVYPTKQSALDSVSGEYYWKGVKTELRSYGISYNPAHNSLEYIELTPCTCDNPNIHSDSAL